MKKFKRILFGFLGFLGAQCISGAIGLAFYHFFSSYGLEIKVLVFVLYLVISSLIITILDQIRRTIAVDKPLNDILNACDKISKGDFNIKLVHSSEYSDNTTVDIIKDHINYMAIELSKSKVMKNDFISNVSHEIKTPLAGIQSYVRLLQNDTHHIMLSHLSDKNNEPHIAYKTVENALIQSGARIGEDIGLCVANRYEVTKFI